MKHPLFVTIVSGLVVALFAAVVFTPLGSAVTQILLSVLSDSDLQLVRADLNESQEVAKSKSGGVTKAHDVVKLDVALRNTGEKVAVIDHAVFHVKKVWFLHASAFPYPLRSTGTYDVRLSPKGAPYRKTREIIRKIPANDADRFTISMDATRDLYDPDSHLHEHTLVYLVNVDLIYDEDNQPVSTGNLLFLRGPLWEGKLYLSNVLKQTKAHAATPNLRAKNILTARRIRGTEGKKSENVKKLVDRILEERHDD
jgi:hypothetical protein